MHARDPAPRLGRPATRDRAIKASANASPACQPGIRLPDVPIARIKSSGYGVDVAASRAAWYVICEGPQTLFVDDEGRAFCAPQGCALMLRWVDARRSWWVGNFTVQRGESVRHLILLELRERLHELRQVAA